LELAAASERNPAPPVFVEFEAALTSSCFSGDVPRPTRCRFSSSAASESFPSL
jgi:hypothetical protein